ncbi:MAG: hypothetical protein ABIS86_17730 [Streptosporangiaceae bacterium]
MKRAVLLPLLTLALGLTGCSGESPAPQDPPSSAVPPTAQFGSVTLPEDPGPLVDTITKQVKAAGSVHADIVSGDERGSADLRTDSVLPMMTVTINDASPTHAVVLGGVVYARTEGSEVEPGRPWARLVRQEIPTAPQEVAAMLTTLLNQIEQALKQVSADTGLGLVRDGVFTRDASSEKLDGVPVRRYDGTTSGEKLPDKKVAKSGLDGIGWTLWVGEDGLPRKFSASLKSAVSTVTYSKWGSPVTVAAPPANQVSSLD